MISYDICLSLPSLNMIISYGCAMRKSGIMPFAATWMDPAIIILSEVS